VLDDESRRAKKNRLIQAMSSMKINCRCSEKALRSSGCPPAFPPHSFGSAQFLKEMSVRFDRNGTREENPLDSGFEGILAGVSDSSP